jgi:hypothetical protein|tara:strand:+ start:149 stop:364 length:216 start_codon:yes stop_codon:yes gene_type:complete
MEEELEPVYDSIARHKQKFGIVPVFVGLHPRIGLVDWYVYEIEEAIRKNKPLNHIESRDKELRSEPKVFID